MKKLTAALFICTVFLSCKEKIVQLPDWMKDFENVNRVIDDRKVGKHIAFDSIGNIIQISTYKAGLLDGECLDFYATGKLKSKVNFQSGKINGAAYKFYPSGVIENIREWQNDKKVGYGVDFYDTSGETKASLLYNNDGFLIQRKSYKKNGTLIEEEISNTYKEQLCSPTAN